MGQMLVPRRRYPSVGSCRRCSQIIFYLSCLTILLFALMHDVMCTVSLGNHSHVTLFVEMTARADDNITAVICEYGTAANERRLPTIQDAITAAQCLQSAGVEDVSVVLLPREASDCHILLSDPPGGVEIQNDVSHLSLVTQPSGSCTHSVVILTNKTHSLEPKGFFRLLNTSHIAFRGLWFVVDIGANIFTIKSSKFIVISKSVFILSGGWSRQHAILLTNSDYVFLTECTVKRNVSHTEVVIPGSLRTFRSPVMIVAGGNCCEKVSINPHSTQWLEDKDSNGLIKASLVKSALYGSSQSTCHREAGNRIPCYVKFVVAILKCTFAGGGIKMPLYSQLEFSMHHLKGGAVEVNMYPCTYPMFVHILGSNFNEISGPESSTVFVRYLNDSDLSSSDCDVGTERSGYQDRRHLWIAQCEFINNTGLIGGAVGVRFDECVNNASLLIDQSYFEGNLGRQGGGAVFFHFSVNTIDTNCVTVVNCTFHRNYVFRTWGENFSPGGAVMSFANYDFDGLKQTKAPLCFPSQYDYPVNFVACNFTSNSGFGAYFSRAISTAFYNTTIIHDNCGTGLAVMKAEFSFHDGPVEISHNRGIKGGGIHIGEFGRMDFRKSKDVRIYNNTAEYKGSAMYIDEISSASVFDKELIYVGVDRLRESCPFLFAADVANDMYKNIIKFNQPNSPDHSDTNKIVPVIATRSWHKCYDPFQIRSMVQVEEADYCKPYPPAEWSTILDNDANTGYEGCRLNANSTESFVVGEGNGFLANQSKPCHTRCQNFTILGKLDMFRKTIETAPSWMFFHSTTAACFKEVGDKVWFFRKDCSRENIFNFSLSNEGNATLQRFDCSIYNTAVLFQRYRKSLSPILPGYPFLLTPWRGPLHSWNQYTLEMLEDEAKVENVTSEEFFEQTCTPVMGGKSIDSGTVLGQVTLYPAPGEEFDLEVDVTDQFFTRSLATLRVKVISPGNNVLLRQDERDYSLNSYLYYSSNGVIAGLALSGIPGSTGHLNLILDGQSSLRTPHDRHFSLSIPFKLRKCFLGFYDPVITNYTEAAEYAKQSRACLAERDTCGLHERSKGDGSKLVCRCAAHIDGVVKCLEGKYALIRGTFWAGNFSGHQPLDLKHRCVYDRQVFLNDSFRLQDDECDVRGGDDFVVGVCDNGLCKNKNSASVWNLMTEDPCQKDAGRTGVLCGDCRNGYNVVISSVACRDCRGHFSISIYIYFLLLFLCSAALFITLLKLNLGASAVLNSWLFFIQAVFIIFSDNIAMRNLFYFVMTMGLGQICIKEQLTILQAQTILMAQPFFMYLFIFLLWLAIKIRRFAKQLQLLQTRHSLAHVVWLGVIYCMTALAFLSASLMNTIILVDHNNNTRRVLFIDGSVEVLSTEHLPYGVFAIVVLLVFVLPCPLILAVPRLRTLRQLKWYTDEAMCVYEPDRSWWAAVDVGRRLLLAIMHGGIHGGRTQRYIVAMSCVILLAGHIAYRPLVRRKKLWRIKDIDNRFEAFLLFVLCLLSVARISSTCIGWPTGVTKESKEKLYMVIYTVPTLIAILMAVVRFIKSRRKGKSRQQSFVIDEDDAMNEEHSSFSRVVSSLRLKVGREQSGPPSPYITSPEELVMRQVYREVDEVPFATGLRDPLLADAMPSPSMVD